MLFLLILEAGVFLPFENWPLPHAAQTLQGAKEASVTSLSLSFGTEQDRMCPPGFGFIRARLSFLTFLGAISSLLELSLPFSQFKQRLCQAPGRPLAVSREAGHPLDPSSLRRAHAWGRARPGRQPP